MQCLKETDQILCTDYMLVDMDLPEPRTAPKAPEPGLLPKMKDAAQQALSKKKSGDVKPSRKYNRSALHIKNLDDKTPEARKNLQELASSQRNLASARLTQKQIEYARSVTGTEVKFRDLNDPNAKQRKDDVRVWDTVNLRCISCRGECPVCAGACCLYANASKAIASESADTEKVEKAKRIVKVVEDLSPQVMDVGTYQLCSQPGGCGRYVCPNCCGVCPNEICRDVQCKVHSSAFPCFLFIRRLHVVSMGNVNRAFYIGVQGRPLGALRLARLRGNKGPRDK
ncbi:hypothetical protein P170DRAFT_436834 [Aspergillus steynii IBT 23096]|uniref:Uncharacterized protein n=1 Tax=Aspergillus steynii IBT 23096 TaxID=1392250 RepID=A0A2I2G8L6_9EURO|nr:uncharacterized protein P170DRAFT_436834 [Aspergillus steynii IBT 23096]PLB49215.1 hypothetical protein P170DRAFT_436834 [Aspergillus steynii IBT 23096]